MYNEFIYHLDLCTLSYHLYSQTLIWPLDPYYEQMARNPTSRRNNFMAEVHRVAGAGIPGHLDPIKYNYNLISPWKDCFVRPEKEWLLYKVPAYIQDRVAAVNLVTAATPPVIGAVPNLTVPAAVGGITRTDNLYCFLGGTGAVGTSPAQESLMGFVLERERAPVAGGGYDVHIIFRGSRSGSGGRAAAQGLITGNGNADWVTDTNNFHTDRKVAIADFGDACRGFSMSIESMLRTIYTILSTINTARGRVAPANIYVSGHSLGGALATHFTSAVLFGNLYGAKLPAVVRGTVPAVLAAWPWDTMKLLTYAAPTVGNRHFISRLNSKIRIFRTRIAADPITQSTINEHAGAEIPIVSPSGQRMPDLTYHEPFLIRRELVTLIANWRDSLDNVPANTPDLHLPATNPWQPNEPWQVYSNFATLFQTLGNEDAIRAVLPAGEFNRNLLIYLQTMRAVYGMRTTYKNKAVLASTMLAHQQAIDPLIAIVNGYLGIGGAALPDVPGIFAAWQAAANVIDPTIQIKGDKPSKHIGVCLIIGAISAGVNNVINTCNGTYPTLYNCLS